MGVWSGPPFWWSGGSPQSPSYLVTLAAGKLFKNDRGLRTTLLTPAAGKPFKNDRGFAHTFLKGFPVTQC